MSPCRLVCLGVVAALCSSVFVSERGGRCLFALVGGNFVVVPAGHVAVLWFVVPESRSDFLGCGDHSLALGNLIQSLGVLFLVARVVILAGAAGPMVLLPGVSICLAGSHPSALCKFPSCLPCRW